MSDQWSERLSDYLDGHLPADEARRMDEHLEGCASCRETLDDLRAVVARARALEDRPPARDLWPGIEAGLLGARRGGAAAEVLDLGDARRATSAGRVRVREVRLSLPQVAAAALLLLVVGGLGTWAMAPGLPGGAPAGGAGGSGTSMVSTDVGAGGEPAVAREMAALKETLDRHGDRLDPNTVRIVEKNLAIIDRAIQESRAALAVDPGNPFLEEHLEGALTRKVDYLREATSLLASS